MPFNDFVFGRHRTRRSRTPPANARTLHAEFGPPAPEGQKYQAVHSAEFLRSAAGLVAQESGTSPSFALQIEARSFANFDPFPDDEARQAHLSGAVAQAMGE